MDLTRFAECLAAAHSRFCDVGQSQLSRHELDVYLFDRLKTRCHVSGAYVGGISHKFRGTHGSAGRHIVHK